jgi:CBS-domain-containing membrane protein
MTKVPSVMSRYLVKVSPDTPAEAALDVLEVEHVHHALVATHNDLEGVICRCDLELVNGRLPVGRCMKHDYVFVDVQTSAQEAADIMQRWGIGFLPVISGNGKLLGVVTRRDLRHTGFLPNQLGVDRCAACGESHSLLPVTDGFTPTFCRNCMEATTLPEGMYATLGVGD